MRAQRREHFIFTGKVREGFIEEQLFWFVFKNEWTFSRCRRKGRSFPGRASSWHRDTRLRKGTVENVEKLGLARAWHIREKGREMGLECQSQSKECHRLWCRNLIWSFRQWKLTEVRKQESDIFFRTKLWGLCERWTSVGERLAVGGCWEAIAH